MANSILIGFHRRSGSTLMKSLMSMFEDINIYGETPSIPVLLRSVLGRGKVEDNTCVKPIDAFYLHPVVGYDYFDWFDKFVWISRIPMDTYLSDIGTGYMYLSYLSREEREGIRVKFFERWKRIYKHYFDNKDKWYLVRYEELTHDPYKVLNKLSDYLGLDYDHHNFDLDKLDIRWDGGDTKILSTDTIHAQSRFRYEDEMTESQIELFRENLGSEMEELGYMI